MILRQYRRTALFCSLPILLSACSSAESSRLQAQYQEETGRLELLKYDADGDGVFETVSHMDGARVLQVEIDRGVDGKPDGHVDRWEHYGPGQRLERVGFSSRGDGVEDAWSYRAPDGSIARIDIAGKRDGKVTRTERYDDNQLVSAEEDTNSDGRVDKWERYDNGRLAVVAFDAAGRGVADRRLVYEADGAVRLELDPDGDGVFVTVHRAQ